MYITLVERLYILARMLGAARKRLIEYDNYLVRQLDQDEVIRREEIILTTLINDAQITITFGIIIRDHAIDLM